MANNIILFIYTNDLDIQEHVMQQGEASKVPTHYKANTLQEQTEPSVGINELLLLHSDIFGLIRNKRKKY